jgi:uncharacterized membrane protein
MADAALFKVAAALGLCIVLAAVFGFVLSRLAENRGGQGLFKAFFLVLVCVYALGFVARYVLVEVLP